MRRLTVVLSILSFTQVALGREVEVSLGSAAHLIRSPSIDAVSQSDLLPCGDVGLAVKVASPPLLDALLVEGHASGGSSKAQDFQLFSAELDVLFLQLGLMATRHLRPNVRGFVRADLASVRGRMALDTGAHRLADVAWTTASYAGFGIDFATRTALKRLSIGLRLETGYTVAQDLSFSARPEIPDDDVARIAIQAAPLGEVNVSGWSGRVSALLRF